MHTSRVAVALGAALALAAAPFVSATAAAAASGTNSGSSHASDFAYVAGTPSGGCTQIMSPAGYPAGTLLADLGGIADFTPVSRVGRFHFSPTLEKRSVPAGWGVWGSPPDTETATPHILYTGAATSITIKKRKSTTLGMEVQPSPFAVHTFTAVYQGKGGASCTITRDADGAAGARVLAATTTFRIKSVAVSSDVQFAIAAVRAKK